MENDAFLIQERQQLLSLLAQYRQETKELPYLKAEETAGWIQQIQTWCQNMAAGFWEWLRTTVGPLPTDSMHINWQATIQGFFWICMVLLVLWITRRVAVKFGCYDRKRQRTQAGGLSPHPHVSHETKRLGQKLSTALATENWAWATRLRWCLFLKDMGYPPHLTPRECFRETQFLNLWEQSRGAPVHDLYRVMFAAASGSQQWYEHYQAALHRLEGQHKRE